MASSTAYSDHAQQIVPNEIDTPLSTPIFRPSSHRSASFSSLSSFSSSSSSGSYLSSPRTPLRLSGIPFSWEKLPGIPKQLQSSKKKESSLSLDLPLPPAAGNSIFCKKYDHEEKNSKKNTTESFRMDPFFAAMVECSKDDDHDRNGGYWKGSKLVTRTLSDRIGFVNMYTSCKRTCAVSESIVYLPRSRTYNLLNRRSSK